MPTISQDLFNRQLQAMREQGATEEQVSAFISSVTFKNESKTQENKEKPEKKQSKNLIVRQVKAMRNQNATDTQINAHLKEVGINPDKFKKIENDYDVNEYEKQLRPTIPQFLSNVYKGGKKEVNDLVDAAGSIGTLGLMLMKEKYQHQDITKRPLTMKLGEIMKDKLSSAVNNPKNAAKKVKEFAYNAMNDYANTFGIDFNRDDFSPDIDVALRKWQDKPITSISDALVLASAVKTVTNGIKTGVNNAGKFLKEKAVAKDILETNPHMDELNQAISTGYKTAKDDLITNRKILSKMSIEQLDSEDYVKQVAGNRLRDNLIKLEKSENAKLTQAVNKVADETVDKSSLYNSIKSKLRDEKLTNKAGEVIPELNKPTLMDELDELNDGTPLTAAELKKRLDTLDDRINWNNEKEVDDGLKVVRAAYRAELGKISPEYDEVASRIHDRLKIFQKKIDSIKKAGGGEQFAAAFFKSRQESELFNEMLAKNPDKIAKAVKTDMDLIQTWQAWNTVFKQNNAAIPKWLAGNSNLFNAEQKLTGAIKKQAYKKSQYIKELFPNISNKAIKLDALFRGSDAIQNIKTDYQERRSGNQNNGQSLNLLIYNKPPE